MSPTLARFVRFAVPLVLGTVFASAQTADETEPGDPLGDNDSMWSMSRMITRMPELLAKRLPGFDPQGALYVTVRPHLHEFLRPGYVLVPVNARWKASDHLEFNSTLNSYFAHGGDAVGHGLSSLTLGVKSESFFPSLTPRGFSVGLDYRMPFSGSPLQFTDGYRHVQPYVAMTRMLVPRWELLGFGTFGANFLEHTRLPSNFGRNQLHANSLALSFGVAREWAYLHASVTARLASTALTSDEGRQNFWLRPEVAVPVIGKPDSRTQIFVTGATRVLWGPDGRVIDTSTGMRVRFHFERKKHVE